MFFSLVVLMILVIVIALNPKQSKSDKPKPDAITRVDDRRSLPGPTPDASTSPHFAPCHGQLRENESGKLTRIQLDDQNQVETLTSIENDVTAIAFTSNIFFDDTLNAYIKSYGDTTRKYNPSSKTWDEINEYTKEKPQIKCCVHPLNIWSEVQEIGGYEVVESKEIVIDENGAIQASDLFYSQLGTNFNFVVKIDGKYFKPRAYCGESFKKNEPATYMFFMEQSK